MDILRYGQRVKVLKHLSLRQMVMAEAKALLNSLSIEPSAQIPSRKSPAYTINFMYAAMPKCS
jgi:hypothetical protein